ncbi:hypothetical protein HN51_022736 [Arachis hypogaea]
MSYYQSAERIPDPSWKYDVYLSFRGQDTRYRFISDLYEALTRAGILALLDDEEIQLGDQISYILVQAIEASRLFVVVFSESYAASTWCLKELTKIMECRSTIGQTVIPLYYNVDPSDVRHQRGPFEKALLRHMDRYENEIVHAWRAALTQATELSGFLITGDSNEVELVGVIVEHITTLLASKDLFIARHPVGVQSRTEYVIQMLHSRKPEDVVLMGIWGMGGVGKTTIAKSVYNQIHRHFDRPMFLPNIREMWENNQQVFLQEQLLNGICKAQINIQNIGSGVALLRERLRLERVFLVLDDVNKIDQLNALCGSREWFGAGSIIIITTRDRRLLRMIGVDYVYQVKEMDYNESLEFFLLECIWESNSFNRVC